MKECDSNLNFQIRQQTGGRAGEGGNYVPRVWRSLENLAKKTSVQLIAGKQSDD